MAAGRCEPYLAKARTPATRTWTFPHRAKQANDTFHALAEKQDGCLAGRATPHSDRSVNHADSYAARRYDLEQVEVSLSVKDKAALGETFVFIRVQGRNGGSIR